MAGLPSVHHARSVAELAKKGALTELFKKSRVKLSDHGLAPPPLEVPRTST